MKSSFTSVLPQIRVSSISILLISNPAIFDPSLRSSRGGIYEKYSTAFNLFLGFYLLYLSAEVFMAARRISTQRKRTSGERHSLQLAANNPPDHGAYFRPRSYRDPFLYSRCLRCNQRIQNRLDKFHRAFAFRCGELTSLLTIRTLKTVLRLVSYSFSGKTPAICRFNLPT